MLLSYYWRLLLAEFKDSLKCGPNPLKKLTLRHSEVKCNIQNSRKKMFCTGVRFFSSLSNSKAHMQRKTKVDLIKIDDSPLCLVGDAFKYAINLFQRE